MCWKESSLRYHDCSEHTSLTISTCYKTKWFHGPRYWRCQELEGSKSRTSYGKLQAVIGACLGEKPCVFQVKLERWDWPKSTLVQPKSQMSELEFSDWVFASWILVCSFLAMLWLFCFRLEIFVLCYPVVEVCHLSLCCRISLKKLPWVSGCGLSSFKLLKL